jgi:mannose-6-phosphate isomerase
MRGRFGPNSELSNLLRLAMYDRERAPAEIRPWGMYYVLDEGPGFKVKRIVVAPDGHLSLQSHKHRNEHWTVIAGEATVTIGDRVQSLKCGESVNIAQGALHRLENFGAGEVQVVEVQFGDYLGEDDITRYEDVYNRV